MLKDTSSFGREMSLKLVLLLSKLSIAFLVGQQLFLAGGMGDKLLSDLWRPQLHNTMGILGKRSLWQLLWTIIHSLFVPAAAARSRIDSRCVFSCFIFFPF